MCSSLLCRSSAQDPKPSASPRAAGDTLSDAEWRKVLEWNDTEASYDGDRCIHELVEAQVGRTPDAPCVVYRDERLSYRDVNERANRLARYLRTLDVRPEVPVALYMSRGPAIIVAMLAVLKAGGAYIPIDVSYPIERLAAIVEIAQAPVLITDEVATPGTGARHVVCLRRDAAKIAAFSSADPERTACGGNAAFVLFTSGSTGKPKGVLVMHRNLVNYQLLWERECALSTSISALCQTAFVSFAVFQGDVVRALCSGKKLVLCTQDELLSPRALHAVMKREGADFAEFVPSLLRSLVAYLGEAGESLDFMRVLVVGADRWYLREHQEARRHLPAHARLIHVYGSSETTLDSTRFEHSGLELRGDRPAPIGRPFTNVQAYVLDEALRPVGIGVEGELCIGGAGVAKGYLALPEETAAKFVVDPFSRTPGARLFRTGDLARWLPDGNLAFLGRRDQQLKIAGFRIEPGEIEAALERHASVAAAIVHTAQTAGDAQVLVGYIVPRGRAPNEDDLRRHLAAMLPDFMVPARFLAVDSFPLTPSGKVDRRALPALDGRRPAFATAYAPPADGLEEIIAGVWRRVLHLDRVGAHDNFIDLGATSLIMAQVNRMLSTTLQRDVRIVDMYRYPTVASLARALRGDSVDGLVARQGQSRGDARRAMSIGRPQTDSPSR